ncbi:MAG: hypothetical protein JKY15_07245 [Deltaproteobacteria bacterium]|nr:hypothetical protein [Deltaproteobacteria bacterium]
MPSPIASPRPSASKQPDSDDGFVQTQSQSFMSWQERPSGYLVNLPPIEVKDFKLDVIVKPILPILQSDTAQQVIHNPEVLEGVPTEEMAAFQYQFNAALKALVEDRVMLQSLEPWQIRGFIDHLEQFGTEILTLNQKRKNAWKAFWGRLCPDYRREQESCKALVDSLNFGIRALRLLIPVPTQDSRLSEM